MLGKVTVLAICLAFVFSGVSAFKDDCGDSHLATAPFPEYVKDKGYPFQEHIVRTEDGYFLTVFRIQAKNQKEFKTGLPAVYLQHGLLDSSDTWIINSERKAPAFILANAGYDVWVANSRGNKYSRRHESLSPSNSKFWLFGWQEMSEYDVPAIMKYINRETDKKVNFVGHSQGTLLMFAALADKNPVVKELIQSYIALGPVFYLTNIETCGMKTLASTPALELLQKFGVGEFMSLHWMASSAASLVCRIAPSICKGALYAMFDTAPSTHDNTCRYKVFIGHFPAGTSLQDVIHFKQVIQSGTAPRKFDYGSIANLKKYGTLQPPMYDLKNIDIPVYLFAGTADKVSVPVDYYRLHRELPKSELKEYDLGHMTFVIAEDMGWFSDVLAVLEKVNSSK